MYFLRLQIYQPQAHYRIPFTYQRRHTYPIPPYSTVIGFLCNVLGIDDPVKTVKIGNNSVVLYEQLKKIKISIAGRFESKTTEYIWFRNLSATAHEKRFASVNNRFINGHVEHIGGQSPVLIDTLDEVNLIIYLAHEDKEFLELIKSSIEFPVRRLEILHLGRAEDWIVIKEISAVSELNFPVKRNDMRTDYFFWIPEKMYVTNHDLLPSDFHQFQGLLYRITTWWEVQDFEKTYNRHGYRNFQYMPVKLNDGLFVRQQFMIDEQHKNFPVFFADLN
ncbi:MAG: type I-B CRISPR-associated protein Cas5 [Thermoflavifilum aggregans]|nr:type I-B CRISPR-associated protein Cas5 [Thermoflavifilum aggregans]